MRFREGQESPAREQVVDHGQRMVVAEPHVRDPKQLVRRRPRLVNVACWQALELREPAANIAPFRIEFDALQNRVHYSKIRLRAATASGNHCHPALLLAQSPSVSQRM